MHLKGIPRALGFLEHDWDQPQQHLDPLILLPLREPAQPEAASISHLQLPGAG